MSGSLSLEIHHRQGAFDLQVKTEIPAVGVTSLFGASGSGKTTLLRLIAGLERPDRGKISWQGKPWVGPEHWTAAHRRPVGMVFQDGRLFDHLDVAGNLRYADKRSDAAGSNITFDAVVEALELSPLLARSTASLSGGESQRVALARTLLRRPALLLLDEPLAALDLPVKARIMPFLSRAIKEFGLPTLYVSHALEEVAQLADRMLVLSDGQILTEGPVASVMERLDLEPITGRFEAGSLLEGTVDHHDNARDLTMVRIGSDLVCMPRLDHLAGGAAIRLRVRARDVAIATQRPEGLSIRNIIPATIDSIHRDASAGFADIGLRLSGGRVRARITTAALQDLALAENQSVYALIKSVSFDRRLV